MKAVKELQELKHAVHRENTSTVRVLELIGHIEESGACLRNGHRSVFDYLRFELKYSEGGAARRLRAARLLKLHPEVKELLITRQVSLCTLSAISRRVRDGDSGLVQEIVGKSKREVDELIALRDGKSVLRETVKPVTVKKQVTHCTKGNSQDSGVRNLVEEAQATPADGVTAHEASSLFEIEERMKVSFSLTSEDFQLVEKAREMFSNRFPKGVKLEELFVLGLKELMSKEEKRLAGLGTRKSKDGDPTKRYIPAALRKAVLERDNYQCTYRYQDGTVCGSKWQVQADHVIPFSLGGRTELENLRCCCQAHNGLLAKDAGLHKKSA